MYLRFAFSAKLLNETKNELIRNILSIDLNKYYKEKLIISDSEIRE